jgi:cell division protein FtsB
MKIFRSIIAIMLFISLLTITACGGRKQSVSKNQFDIARQETIDAEARVAELRAEASNLSAELSGLNAKLQVLQEMEREGQ